MIQPKNETASNVTICTSQGINMCKKSRQRQLKNVIRVAGMLVTASFNPVAGLVVAEMVNKLVIDMRIFKWLGQKLSRNKRKNVTNTCG